MIASEGYYINYDVLFDSDIDIQKTPLKEGYISWPEFNFFGPPFIWASEGTMNSGPFLSPCVRNTLFSELAH